MLTHCPRSTLAGSATLPWLWVKLSLWKMQSKLEVLSCIRRSMPDRGTTTNTDWGEELMATKSFQKQETLA